MAVSLNILAAVRESTSGKLVIFAGLEAGVGKTICAANVAVRLSQRWKCVAIDMDGMDGGSGSLHKYLGVPPPDPRAWKSPEDPFTSLSSFKTKTRFPNLDFIHWSAEFPPVDLFCQTLQSYPADYVFLTLNPGASDEALDLFAAADVPILVTSPSGAMQDKALDFLRRFSWRGFGDRQGYIILNQLQRGGEERENNALIEKARHSFGLNVNVFGTVLYNPDALTNLFLGAAPAPLRSKSQTALVFEDMTLKIERLLPRGDSSKGGIVPARRAAGLVATLSESAREAVAASIGGKARRLEEELRQKDEIIRSLHQRYDVAVADLQQMLKNRNSQVADHAATIQSLQEEIRHDNDRISERTDRFLDLESAIATREAEVRNLQDQIQRFEQTNAMMALDRTEAMRRVTEQLAEQARQAGEAEHTIAGKHAEIRRLEGELNRIQEDSRALAQATAREKQEKLSLQALNQRVIAELSQKAAQLSEMISSQAKTESDFKDAIAAERMEIQRVEDELNRLRNTNSLLAEEKRALQHTTERVLAETAQRDDSLRQLGEQLAERNARTAELEAFIAANQTGVHELEDDLNRLKEANSDLAKGQLSLQRTTEGILARRDDTIRQLGEKLFERTGRAAELEAAAAARQADVHRLEIELIAIRESNRVLIEEKIALQQTGEAIVVERQETIRQFTEQLAQQRRRATEIESDLAAARLQIHRLEDTNRALTQEGLLLQLANESAVTERNETVRHLDEQLLDKAARSEELEAAIASQRAAVEQLQVEIRRLNGMNELFMEEKATLRHENERLVTERSDIGRRIAELEDVLREREALIERKDKMIQDVEVRLAQRASDQGTIEDRTAEALRQLSCEIALQREDSRTMVESCRNLAQSIEQLTRVVTEQVNEIARSRDHLRLEISEIEESRRVKYTSVPPAEKPKKFHAVNNPPPKLELVPSSENTSAKLDLGALLRQRRTLVESLRKQPPHSVTIIPIIEGGKDSFDFAIELQAILESVGWSVGFVTSTFEANQFYGLHIVTDGSNIAQSTASILSTAFRKGRVGFTETTAESSGGLDPVRLIVGIHNVALIVSSAFS